MGRLEVGWEKWSAVLLKHKSGNISEVWNA